MLYTNGSIFINVENNCGDEALSEYQVINGDTEFTLNGSYTCSPDSNILETLQAIAGDVEEKFQTTFGQYHYVTSIDWRNAVEWFEI